MKIECTMIIESFSELPDDIVEMNCSINQLTSLPKLPKGLKVLNCSNNNLTSLPELPKGLKRITCSYNNITSLPELPDSLIEFVCSQNNITSLPKLPDKLNRLVCYNNPLECMIPTKFRMYQDRVWISKYYNPYIISYEGQKKILEQDVTQITELILHLKYINSELHPKIKKEFAYVLNGADLNLI